MCLPLLDTDASARSEGVDYVKRNKHNESKFNGTSVEFADQINIPRANDLNTE